jgi:hypothetical protein
MTDDEIERVSQRVADLLFHKFMRRLAKAAAVGESLPAAAAIGSTEARQSVKPSAADLAEVSHRRARRGVY